MPKAKPKAAKPAKLQVNLAGAWKDVARFEAADDEASGAIVHAASDIGSYAIGNVRFRIVIDDALNEVLTHWTRPDGWKEARNAKR